MQKLRNTFEDREDLARYLRETFDDPTLPHTGLSPIEGGRRAAERALERIEPRRYRDSRNHLDGAVTRLSPYIRHGIVSLAEARAVALDRVAQPADAQKFVSELGWRDYWRRVYADLGEGVWQDREPLKTGFAVSDDAERLPAEVREARSGLACMDAFARELGQTGYLHNHARMWLAAWIVHWLRVRWQAGARWFLAHLLDGDPASNNLSWQWVASTFSRRPYFFNRENVERYTDARYCRECAVRNACPFDGSYEELERRLFPNLPGGHLTPR